MVEEIFKHDLNYLSANCNRKPHAFDIRGHHVVYPSCQSVCVYDYLNYIHVQLLTGHTGQVNCCRWVEGVDCIVSCGLDGQVILWQFNDDSHMPFYFMRANDGLISVHTIVTSFKFAGHETNPDHNFFTAASLVSQKIAFWYNDKPLFNVDMDYFTFDIRLMHIGPRMFGNAIFIAHAGSDPSVQTMVLDENQKLHKLAKLGGHEDWIQSIDVLRLDGARGIYLASGCQDHYIRIWKISRISSKDAEKGHVYEVMGRFYEVSIETILLGHEGWVYSVQLLVNSADKACLLSASMDKSIVLWSVGDDDEIWSESLRVGDVGGSSLGFVGALANREITQIIGQSFNGAVHLWKKNQETNSWVPEVGIGGHWEIINDLVWEPNGLFLLTCSLDQTTRLHSQWAMKDRNTWHEIARPQIHGYDLNCITVIDALTFASGADEKVLRVFSGTKSFIQNYKNIAHSDTVKEFDVKRKLPECASVPPLGLSNKAIYEEVDMDEYFKSVIVNEPPLEEVLQQNTLWPEIQKLYGHSYELFAVTCNKSCTLLASACKATKTDHANVIIWDIKNDFKKLQELYCHSLTITQLRFSPDDRYLVSVSRDRTWCLYEIRDAESTPEIIKIGNSDKKTSIHSRIIWDVTWTPDSRYFITCSRDKKAIVWAIGHASRDNDPNSCLGPVKPLKDHLTVSQPIITIDVSSYHDPVGYVVTLGLENGFILLYRWSLESGWRERLSIQNCHTLQVRRIRFRPNDQRKNFLTFASCGDDRKVIVHKVRIEDPL